MINLILKDFKLMKKIVIIGMIYMIFVIVGSFMLPIEMGNIMYCLLIIFMTYLSVLYADGYEEMNKGYLILASLPIRRHFIVASKYLALALYYIIYSIMPLIILGIASTIAGRGFKTYSLFMIILSFIVLGIVYSIYYPIYYKFGYKALKVYKILVFVFIFLVPKWIVEIIKSSSVPAFIDNKVILLIAMFVVIGILCLSYAVSAKIYEKKELI